MLQRHTFITDIRNKRNDVLFKNALMKIFFNEIEYKASSKSDNLTNY